MPSWAASKPSQWLGWKCGDWKMETVEMETFHTQDREVFSQRVDLLVLFLVAGS